MEEESPIYDKRAATWMKMLEECSEREWHDRCDQIDKYYAPTGKAEDYTLFWANLEVLRPTVYSRSPAPVVTPRFKDRRPLARRSAELLERVLQTDLERDHVHDTLQLVRDDLLICGRGAVWIVAEAAEDGAGVSVRAEHVTRVDYRHAHARKWSEVEWVAKRSYVTRDKGRARFGDAFADVRVEQRSMGRGPDERQGYGEPTGEVWEIWHRPTRYVVWVAQGPEDVLDAQPPHVEWDGFFPCPRPAYSTLQRDTLRPVPDLVYYQSQLDEIELLTKRINGLAKGLRVWGFVPGSRPQVGDTLRHALEMTGNAPTITTIAGLSEFSASGGKLVEWFPTETIAQTIAQLVELRRQLIDDVYQITGLSDIMRGATEASETATAQQLKSQYGAIRVRSHQEEMVRVARDVIRMKAEVYAESAPPEQLLAMSQVDDLPQAAQLQAQMQQAMMTNPQAAQALQAQMAEVVTIDAVMQLLRGQRTRPFVLEVESDSTIQPDEDAEKQRRVEFLTSVGGFFQQALPLVQAMPQSAALAGRMLQFVASGFRAGRELESSIDEFVEQVTEMSAGAAQAQQGPSPEQQAAEAELQMKKADLDMKREDMVARLQIDQQRAASDMEIARMKAGLDLQIKASSAQIKAAENVQ